MISKFNLSKYIKFLMAVLVVAICFVTSFPVFKVSAQDENSYDQFYDELMNIYQLYDDDETMVDDDDHIEDQHKAEIGQQSEDGQVYATGINDTQLGSDEKSYEDDLSIESSTNPVDVVDDKPLIKRLIVSSYQDVDSFGAVAKAEYQNVHIFQYASVEDARNAYDHFQNSNLNVTYDYVVTTDSLESGLVASDAVVTDTIDNGLLNNSQTNNNVQSFSTYTSNPWNAKAFYTWGNSFVGYSSFVSRMYSTQNSNGSLKIDDIVVAVLDSGINTSHSLFYKDGVKAGRIDLIRGRNFTDEASGSVYEFEDLNGHGSHTSGTIAELTLDNVTILPLKVLRSNGKGLVSYIINALSYLKNMKKNGMNIKVANMSLGIESNTQDKTSTTLNDEVQSVIDMGISVVVSAGNSSMNVAYCSPANVADAITVSALAQSGSNLSFAYYSNYGSYIDFCAPGSNIKSAGTSTYSSTAILNGTSMAAPHVAAAVALVYSHPNYSKYTNDEVVKLLKNNATDLGTTGFDNYYGWGCINLESVGVVYDGYVEFLIDGVEAKEGEYENSFSLTLNYDSNATIYYSTDPFATYVDSSDKKYTGPITISSTTKVTAVAIFNNGSSNATQTYCTSKTFYFNSYDLLSNFEMDVNSDKSSSNVNYVTITKYNGILTTLNLTSLSYMGKMYYIEGIGEKAFNNTNVKYLTLPSTLSSIDDAAFKSNNTIVSVKSNSNLDMSVGNYAFYYCTNLETVELPNVSSIGSYAFYRCTNLKNVNVIKAVSVENAAFYFCTNLKKLELMFVETVGTSALSGSGIENIYFGKYLTSIGAQSNLSIETVYGYAGVDKNKSASEQFAWDKSLNFYDLTLRFTQTPNSEIYITQNTSFTIDYFICGANLSVHYSSKTMSQNPTFSSVNLGEFDNKVTYQFQGLTSKIDFTVTLQDYYGTTVSKTTTIRAMTQNSLFAVNISGEHFDVFENENTIVNGNYLPVDISHTLTVVPSETHEIVCVYLNGKIVDLDENGNFTFIPNSDNVEIDVVTNPKKELTVNFSISNNGAVKYDGKNVLGGSVSANNGQNVTFSVILDDGYYVSEVILNNKSQLLPNPDGTYTISKVDRDSFVEIKLQQQENLVQIVWGRGGSLASETMAYDKVDGDSRFVETLRYGVKQQYKIVTYDGYKVDFVSVNGKIVDVVNNTFVLQNLAANSDEIYEVVISFKKNNLSVFDNNVFLYFIIILVVFVLFVFAKFVLFAVRKKQKEQE